MLTTRSPSPSRMPRTPWAGLPIGRTSRLRESYGPAVRRRQDDLLGPVGQLGVDQFVTLLQADRDDAAGTHVDVCFQRRLLDDPFLRCEHQVVGAADLLDRDRLDHLLALLQLRQEVDDRLALGVPAADRQLPCLEHVNASEIRDEHQLVVRQGDEHVGDVVLLLRLHADEADAAALLLLVRVQRYPLDVPVGRAHDHHVLVRDQVLDIEVERVGHDLRPPFVAVLLPQFQLLALHDAR